MTSIKIIFSLFNDSINPELITSQLGIIPSNSWSKGDQLPSNNRFFRKESCWQISTKERDSLDLEREMKIITDILDPKKIEIIKLIREHSLISQFEVVIRVKDNQPPSLVLNKETISFANDLMASVDFDLYMA